MSGAYLISRKLHHLIHPDLSRSLTAFSSLIELKQIHAHILVSGLGGDRFTTERLLACAAVSAFADIPYSRRIFANTRIPTRFMYNTMIRALSEASEPAECAEYYLRMLRSRVTPDRLTLPFLIKVSLEEPFGWFGMQVQCHALKWGLSGDVFVINNLISMYSERQNMGSARKVFDQSIEVVDEVSWTALVSGYANAGELALARLYFDHMPLRNLVSWNAMIAAYARARKAEEARHLLDQMPERTVVSWSSMISGFTQSGLFREALTVFKEMLSVGVTPNEPALVSAVSACAQLRALEQGKWIYGMIDEYGIEINVTLGTALIDMFGKCGSIASALQVFNGMPVRNIVSWNSMLIGLAMNGSERQALTLFWKIVLAGLTPNAVTFLGVLSACSHSGQVDEGRLFFNLMIREYGIQPMPEHYGCMVDLLGRSGHIREALEFVEKMPVQPHAGLVGSLVNACRIHGEVELGEELGKCLIDMEPQHGGRYTLLHNVYVEANRRQDAAKICEVLKDKGAVKVPGNSVVEPNMHS